MAPRGDSGTRMPTAARTAPSAANPRSATPQRRSCSAARRRSSSACAPLAPSAARSYSSAAMRPLPRSSPATSPRARRSSRPQLAVRRRQEIEGGGVEARGAVEGERAGRLLGGGDDVLAGALRVASPLPVDGEHLVVPSAARLEGRGDLLVQLAPLRLPDARHDGLAHAIVKRLHCVRQARAARAHEARDAEHGQRATELARVHVARVGGGVLRQRRSDEAHDLEGECRAASSRRATCARSASSSRGARGSSRSSPGERAAWPARGRR